MRGKTGMRRGNFDALGAAVKSIKTTLKARYGVTRPSTETTSFDLARIYYWAAAIRRVKAAYTSAHNGRKPRLLRPRRFTEKMQWRKLFDLDPIYTVFCDKVATREFVAGRIESMRWCRCFVRARSCCPAVRRAPDAATSSSAATAPAGTLQYAITTHGLRRTTRPAWTLVGLRLFDRVE